MIEKLLVILIILLPLQFALNVGDNVDLVITRVLVPAVFLLWLIRGFAQKKFRVANQAQTWLLLSFLFLSLVSLWGGLDWTKGIRKVLYLFSVAPIYFVAADLARNEKFRAKTARIIWASGVLAAITGLLQFALPFILGLEATLKIWKKLAIFFLGSSFGKLVATNPSWLVNVSGETWMRAFGVFADPHIFSFFVSLCFFTGLGLLLRERNNFLKIMYLAGSLLMVLAIGFSFSRGAYLGAVAGTLFFLALLLKRKNVLGKAVIAGAVVLAAVLIIYQQVIFQRLVSAFNFKEGSNIERLQNWRQAADMIQDYPLFGVGLGNYSARVDPTAGERSSIYAHNLFLDIAAETGILNGIVFLTLLAVGIWQGVAAGDFLGLGTASGFVYFFVHGIFDTPIWSPQVMIMLLVIIAIGASPNVKLKYQNEK